MQRPSNDYEELGSIPLTETLTYRTTLQCSFLCVKAARVLINVIYDNFTTGQGWGVKPNWLYGVLRECIRSYTLVVYSIRKSTNTIWTLDIYVSATVLIAARLRPAIRPMEISESDLEVSWVRALNILETFQNDILAARRSVAALKNLYEKLPRRMPHAPANLGSDGDTMADNNQGIGSQQTSPLNEPRHFDNQMTNPFLVTEGTGPCGYQDQQLADEASMANVLDMSWLGFMPEVPETVLDPYGTFI